MAEFSGGGSISVVKSTMPPGAGGGRSRRKNVRGRKRQKPVEEKQEVPETPVQPAPGAGADGVIDKRTLCVDALADGFVQSFVDFFYLTHRPDPTPDPLGENQDREIQVAVGDMVFIKERLVQAEAARRRAGQIQLVYSSYNELAKHFQERNDHKTGIYFYEKCLEIARMTVDPLGEMTANHNLGLAYEGTSEYPEAIQFHERHLELAQLANESNQQRIANEQLVRVYRGYAELVEKEGDFEEAASYHAKCLDAAKNAGERDQDKENVGLANYRLGRVYVLLGKSEEGMGHLENYLAVCEGRNDLEGQGQAYSALAAAHQSINNSDEAVASLQKFLKIAERTDNLKAQAEACCNLGVIYNQKCLFDRAVEYFQQNYDITRNMASRGEGDLRLVDKARVNLGMAKGNQSLGSYMYVINYDVRSLLKWKNSRVEIMQTG